MPGRSYPFGKTIALRGTAAAACAALWFGAPVLAAGCELPAGALRAETADFTVGIVTQPATVIPDRVFEADLYVCPRSSPPAVVDARVDARMPRHDHGMNYRPLVQRVGEGRFHVSGLVFHMPGLWEFVIDLHADDRSQRAILPVRVE